MTPQSSGWTQWHLNHFLLMVHDDQPQLGSCYCRTIRSSTDRENAVRRRPWMFCFFSWNLPVSWRRRSSAADPSYASLEFGMLNTRPVQLPQQLSICLPPPFPAPPTPGLVRTQKTGEGGAASDMFCSSLCSEKKTAGVYGSLRRPIDRQARQSIGQRVKCG